jgi:hypothetical protein
MATGKLKKGISPNDSPGCLFVRNFPELPWRLPMTLPVNGDPSPTTAEEQVDKQRMDP